MAENETLEEASPPTAKANPALEETSMGLRDFWQVLGEVWVLENELADDSPVLIKTRMFAQPVRQISLTKRTVELEEGGSRTELHIRITRNSGQVFVSDLTTAKPVILIEID